MILENKTAITMDIDRPRKLRSLKICTYSVYVTEFAKTDLMGTNTEIHFLPVDESHTHALSRNTKHLRLDGQVCFFRQLFPTL